MSTCRHCGSDDCGPEDPQGMCPANRAAHAIPVKGAAKVLVIDYGTPHVHYSRHKAVEHLERLVASYKPGAFAEHVRVYNLTPVSDVADILPERT